MKLYRRKIRYETKFNDLLFRLHQSPTRAVAIKILKDVRAFTQRHINEIEYEVEQLERRKK